MELKDGSPRKKSKIHDIEKPEILMLTDNLIESDWDPKIFDHEAMIKVASKWYRSPLEPIIVITWQILVNNKLLKDHCKAHKKTETHNYREVKEWIKALKWCLNKGFRRIKTCTDLHSITNIRDTRIAFGPFRTIRYKCNDYLAKFESWKIKFEFGDDMKSLNQRTCKKLEEELEKRELIRNRTNHREITEESDVVSKIKEDLL